MEFEKEDIYEELKKQEESMDVSKMKPQEAVQRKEELRDKRLVVSEQRRGTRERGGNSFEKILTLGRRSFEFVKTISDGESFLFTCVGNCYPGPRYI